MKFLIDTSVLLRLRLSNDPNRAACAELVDQLRYPRVDGVICAQVLIEYWAVATRPMNANGFGLSPAEVDREIHQFQGLLPLLVEPPDVFHYWHRLVTRFGVRGRPTHDARLIAIADAFGISGLITLNKRDFVRYPHIACLTPQEWIAANPRQAAP